MGNIVFNMFHQNRIDLDREIVKHPALIEILKNQDADELELRLAEIALYCDVVLHGDYLPSDLDNICGILFKALVQKRVPIIIVGSSTPEKKGEGE